MSKKQEEVEKFDQIASADHQEVEKEESDASTDQKPEIDYKAELEKVKLQNEKLEEERNNYKTGLLNLKKKKVEKEEESEEDDEDDEVNRKIDKRLGSFESKFIKGAVEAYLTQMTDDPAKRELIRHHYNSSIVKTGVDPESIKEDLDTALLIVDKKVLMRNMKELATSLHNRQGTGAVSQGSGDSGVSASKAFFSEAQLNELRSRGFDDKKIELLKKNLKKAQER